MSQQFTCESGSDPTMLDPRSKQSQRPSSSVYTLLPSMLQSRIPKLPFLRRSATVGTTRKFYCSARNRQRRLSNTGCASVHPPSPDQGSSSSSTSTDRWLPSNSDAEDIDSIDNDPFTLSDRPLSKPIPPPSVSLTVDLDSGILWRYADQGLSLLMRSFQECSGVAGAMETSSRFFSRQLYVHALTYLLRGLPEDLTSEEQMSICSALPKSVLKSNQITMHSDAPQSQTRSERPVAQAYNIHPSVLHRILANCIIHTFLLIQILLPYLRIIAYSAYRFERENRVSERLFYSTINTIDEVGKRSLRYTDAICKLNDGRVGEALIDLAGWWIREVAGGVHEGLVEGMVILGAPKADYRQMRGQTFSQS